MISKRQPNYFLLIAFALVFLLLVLFFFFKLKIKEPIETNEVTVSSPTTEILQNVVSLISYDEKKGAYENEILKFSFNFDDDVLIEEHQEIINSKEESSLSKAEYFEVIKLRTYLLVKDKASDRDVAIIRIENTPYLKNYKNFSEAASDTFEYWRSSTSQFTDSEQNRYSNQTEFSVLDNGILLTAYKYTIYRPNETLIWIYIPQKHTTASEQLSKNAVNFVSIQYNQNDEQKMSKVVKSFVLN